MAAMVTMITMATVAMAPMTAENHVPQGQDPKQTQHFMFLLIVSHIPVIRYVYRIRDLQMKIQDSMSKIQAVILQKAHKMEQSAIFP